MKRNENLVPLSHDHHHGLLFSTRLKKIENTDKETAVEYINDYYTNHLQHHFQEEEDAFLHLIKEEQLRAKFLNDHTVIKSIIEGINSYNEDVYSQAKILSLAINNHIRFEERVLFPWLENNLDDKTLFTIGNDLDIETNETEAHAFEPAFWEKV